MVHKKIVKSWQLIIEKVKAPNTKTMEQFRTPNFEKFFFFIIDNI